METPILGHKRTQKDTFGNVATDTLSGVTEVPGS